MKQDSRTKEQILAQLALLQKRIADIEAAETERNRAEQALRERERQLQALIESSLDDVAVLNSDGTVRYQSPSMGRVLGYEPADQTGINTFDYIHPDDRETAARSLEKVRHEPGSQLHIELRAPHNDGTWHTLEVVLRNLLDDPVFGGILANFRDITERKLAEESRIKHAATLARAEELQRSRQRIVTVQESLRRDIAQQLHGTVQNRLIILLHRLSEMEHTAPTPDLREELNTLHDKLIDIMENHVRPISHRLYPSILRRGLYAALQSLADQFETTLSIEMDLAEELSIREMNDPRFIPEQVRLSAYRIAEEALTNAMKYARQSIITMQLKPLSDESLLLRVADDGPGFDAEEAANGLGTLMMQDYAEMVGGICRIKTAPGNGTEISVTLPLVEPDGERLARTKP